MTEPALALALVRLMTVLFVLLLAVVGAVDRRMPSAPVRETAPDPGGRAVTAE